MAIRNHRLLCGVRVALLTGSLAVAGASALIGCANPQQQQNGQRAQMLDSHGRPLQHRGPPAPRDDFERSGDQPITPDTFYAAGQLAEAHDAIAQALEQYDKALKLDPNHAASLFRVGVLYAKARQYPQAIAAWQRYLKITDGDATGFANLGFCQELAGRSDEAETSYLHGIKKDPTNAPCRVNYGLMLARHGKFNEATLEMQTVLSEAEVHYNLASVYESMSRKEQAKVEYRKALDLDPGMKEAQARLDLLN